MTPANTEEVWIPCRPHFSLPLLMKSNIFTGCFKCGLYKSGNVPHYNAIFFFWNIRCCLVRRRWTVKWSQVRCEFTLKRLSLTTQHMSAFKTKQAARTWNCNNSSQSLLTIHNMVTHIPVSWRWKMENLDVNMTHSNHAAQQRMCSPCCSVASLKGAGGVSGAAHREIDTTTGQNI